MKPSAKYATYLTQLDLKNVKSFLGSQTLDLTDEIGRPAQWTLIMGNNGVGKTTLLECLAHLAPDFNSDDSGKADPKMFIEPRVAREENSVFDNLGRNGDIKFKMKATFAVYSQLNTGIASTDIIDTSMTFSRTDGKIKDLKSSNWGKKKKITESKWSEHSKFDPPLILAYGAGRHMGVKNLDFDNAPEETQSLLQGNVKFFDVEELLDQIFRAAHHSGATDEAITQERVLLEMIASLLPEVEHAKNIKIYPPTAIGSQGKSGVYIVTKDGEVRFNQISFGYQTMMAWLADISWRLFARYPESKDPLKEPAIILIDEIDLHLHPSWQRQLRKRLSLHFPNVQFIATAHSPLMAQDFLDANLAVVIRQGDHSIIENDPVVLANWRVDQIVTSDLFGLSTAWPPEIDALFSEKRELLKKPSPTAKDKARLKIIERKMLELPTQSNQENEKAMAIILKAAALMKSKVAQN